MIRIRKEALDNIHKAQRCQKTYYDKLHSADKLSIKVGTLVLLERYKERFEDGAKLVRTICNHRSSTEGNL